MGGNSCSPASMPPMRSPAHAREECARGVPVFAVGERSAQAMRDSGFADVSSADGGVGDLARLVGERMTPAVRAPVSRAARSAPAISRAKLGSRKFCRANDRGLSRRRGRASAARGNRCIDAGHRGRVALFAPQRRGLCERGARRRVASERAKAGPLLSVRPNRRAARAGRRRHHPCRRSGPSRPR